MTTDAHVPNHVTAQIEQAGPKVTKDGIRFNVTLSFPFKAHQPLALFLMELLTNPIDVDFTKIQARLPEGTQATITGPNQDVPRVMVRTTVDGVEADVELPVREGGRRNAILPHPYKDDTETKGKCVYCKHGEAYTAHDQARIDAAARAARDKGLASVTPHVFEGNGRNEEDTACKVCGRGLFENMPDGTAIHGGQELFDAEKAKASQNGNGALADDDHFVGVNKMVGDKLIEAASETEAVPS